MRHPSRKQETIQGWDPPTPSFPLGPHIDCFIVLLRQLQGEAMLTLEVKELRRLPWHLQLLPCEAPHHALCQTATSKLHSQTTLTVFTRLYSTATSPPRQSSEKTKANLRVSPAPKLSSHKKKETLDCPPAHPPIGKVPVIFSRPIAPELADIAWITFGLPAVPEVRKQLASPAGRRNPKSEMDEKYH